jgi:hypothetical protein
MLTVIVLSAIMVASCKKTPAPTVEIFATVNGYTVTFTPKVTDVDKYSWNFGDNQTSTESKPSHTYAVSGNYTVTLTVKGDGGSASANKDITIAASFLEMLTGGTSVTNGKTWVLDQTATPELDGRGPVSSSMPVTTAATDDFLLDYNLDTEYDNEYTFFANGDYSVNTMNGNVLAGAIYSSIYGITQGEPAYDIEMCQASYTPSPGATWEMHSADLIVDAITDPNTTDIPPIHDNVTFTGKTWISITGAFFGILDFPTTQKFIIKDIAADKIHVALFLCGYGFGDDEDMMALPTNLIHLTFIPKTTK